MNSQLLNYAKFVEVTTKAMKPLLLAMLIILSANAQSMEETLKSKVLKIETDKAVKSGSTLADVPFASFQYKLIPIKVTWDEFYEVNMQFRGYMGLDSTYPQLLKRDKLNGTHQADSLLAASIQKAYRKSPKQAYLKEKYGNADPDRMIYEITYYMNYKHSGKNVRGDKQMIDFYQNDLSRVHFLN